MTPMLFIGVWLCSYRLTRIFTRDSLVDGARNAWFSRFPPTPEHARLVNAQRPSKWGQLVMCGWCIGFWVSGLVVLSVANWNSMPQPVLWWFATSTAVGLTARLDG